MLHNCLLEGSSLRAFADFHGDMVDDQLPIWSHWAQNWEDTWPVFSGGSAHASSAHHCLSFLFFVFFQLCLKKTLKETFTIQKKKNH